MRIAIIGAGIVGVSTAYELAHDGHEVTVFDRAGGIAAESSFAPGGLFGPAWASSWLAPGTAWSPLPLATRGLLSPREIGTGVKALTWAWRHRQVHRLGPEDRTAALLGLTTYSQQRLGELVGRLGIPFEQSQGTLVLFGDASQEKRAQAWMASLGQAGVTLQRLDADGIRRLEPGLAPPASLHAGALLREEGAGNCRLLAQGLRTHAQARGAQFLLGHEVRRIRPGRSVELSLEVAGRQEVSIHDAVILCAGARSADLARTMGIRLPLLALWGQTLTAPLSSREGEWNRPPRHAVVDLRHRITLTPLGHRIRVTGGYDLTERGLARNHTALRRLYDALELWFPGAIDLGRAQTWSGCQPMLAGGVPHVGPGGPPNVWFNTGHGGAGMALACGSARILADQIAGQPAFPFHPPP